jgi:hypothetical protein
MPNRNTARLIFVSLRQFANIHNQSVFIIHQLFLAKNPILFFQMIIHRIHLQMV